MLTLQEAQADIKAEFLNQHADPQRLEFAKMEKGNFKKFKKEQ